MPPVIQNETSIGAGASNNNLFSGSAFEIMRRRSVISLGITAAATGSFVAATSGSDVLLEESAPIVKTVMPVIPDDMYYNDIAEQGDRLRVSVRNPTGGAVIHRAVALITEL